MSMFGDFRLPLPSSLPSCNLRFPYIWKKCILQPQMSDEDMPFLKAERSSLQKKDGRNIRNNIMNQKMLVRCIFSLLLIFAPSVYATSMSKCPDFFLLETNYEHGRYFLVPFQKDVSTTVNRSVVEGNTIYDQNKKAGHVKSVQQIAWPPPVYFRYDATVKVTPSPKFVPGDHYYYYVSSVPPTIRGLNCPEKHKKVLLREKLAKIVEKEFDLRKIGDPDQFMRLDEIFAKIQRIKLIDFWHTYREIIEPLNDECTEFIYGGVFFLRLEVFGELRKDGYFNSEWLKEGKRHIIKFGRVTVITVVRNSSEMELVFKKNKDDAYGGTTAPVFVVDIDRDGYNEIVMKKDFVSKAQFSIFWPRTRFFSDCSGWIGYH